MHGLTNDTNRRLLAVIGFVAIASGSFMSGSFGYSMSFLHAVSFGLLTIAAGVMWGPIDDLDASGWRKMAKFGRVVGICFIAAELFSHSGYVMGNRVESVEKAGFQNAKTAGIIDNAKLNAATLETLRGQLATLQAEKPWVATVTADGLRGQLRSANLAIEQESKRGGCGPKCLSLTRDRDDLEARVSAAEKKRDLDKQIADLGKVVNERADKAEATEYTSSKVASQTMFVSQLATWSLKPSEAALTWTQIGIGFIIALVTTFLGPACWYLATADHSQSQHRESQPQGRPEAMPAPTHHDAAHKAPIAPSILQIGSRTLKEWAEDVASGRVATAGAR